MTITSTMRDSTRAVSSTGSPRSRCVSRGDRKTLEPPSCAMPASNETRVRVEDFSKIMAMVLPVSGAMFSPRWRRAFSSLARRISPLSSAGLRSMSVRKWRTLMSCSLQFAAGQEAAYALADAADDLIGLGIAQDERRQQAHHRIGGDVQQQGALAG